ncbi:hypothetical protein ZWY2020_029518, partial [Hordeum vulgare]
RGQGLHGQPRCMVLASDEWRLFNIGYTNHHYELLPLLCYNHALFHGFVRISMLFAPCLTWKLCLTLVLDNLKLTIKICQRNA